MVPNRPQEALTEGSAPIKHVNMGPRPAVETNTKCHISPSLRRWGYRWGPLVKGDAGPVLSSKACYGAYNCGPRAEI